jgi:hypothetical protein
MLTHSKTRQSADNVLALALDKRPLPGQPRPDARTQEVARILRDLFAHSQPIQTRTGTTPPAVRDTVAELRIRLVLVRNLLKGAALKAPLGQRDNLLSLCEMLDCGETFAALDSALSAAFKDSRA